VATDEISFGVSSRSTGHEENDIRTKRRENIPKPVNDPHGCSEFEEEGGHVDAAKFVVSCFSLLRRLT